MKTKAYSEIELVNRAGTDLDAFGELVERYRGSIQRQCFSRVKDRDYAEDLAQETFIRAYTKLDQLQEPELFPNWLRKIASNICNEFLRSPARHEHSWEELPTQPDDAPARASELSKHLSELSEEARICVELYYSEQLSYSEIAEVLDVSEGTVRNRLHRAKTFLREVMADMVKNDRSAFTKRVIQKLEELRSKDPRERIRAANDLHRSLAQDQYQSLLAVLHGHITFTNPQWVEQESAYRIEGAIRQSRRYNTAEVRDALIDLMFNHDYEEIRLKAAGALVAQKDPAAIPYLKQAMEDPRNPREVVASAKSAISQLEKLPPAPPPSFENRRLRKDMEHAATDKATRLELIKRFKSALLDPSAKVRTDAAKALGELGDKRAVPALINALEDTDENVKIVTIQALGKLKSKRAVSALLKTGGCLAGAALAKIGATEALPALLEAERDRGDSKSLSIMALAPYGIIERLTTPENLPEVKRILNSMWGKMADHVVEWALMAALAKSENPDDVQDIIDLIEQSRSHPEGPRKILVPKLQAALARIGTDQAFDALNSYLQQGSETSAYAMVGFGQRGLDALKEAMKSEHIATQQAALRSMFFAGGDRLAANDTQAVEILTDVAELGSTPTLRMCAKGTLRKIRRQ